MSQNPHLGPAIGAGQRVGLPDLGDEPPPLGRAGRGIRLMALSRVFGLRRARLGANAPSLVGIPTVVAHELEAFVGNVLGDRRDEVGGRERREVAALLLGSCVSARGHCRHPARRASSPLRTGCAGCSGQSARGLRAPSWPTRRERCRLKPECCQESSISARSAGQKLLVYQESDHPGGTSLPAARGRSPRATGGSPPGDRRVRRPPVRGDGDGNRPNTHRMCQSP